MICKIADLIVQIPEAGDMFPRCQAYLHYGPEKPDIIIDSEKYNPVKYAADFTEDMVAYMESGRQFHARLLHFDGLYLHASALEADGKAYLFSGPSGTGKSTHAGLWQQLLGDRVCRFNDDKPSLRRLDGRWYAYGTPWCGKDSINLNKKVPIAGICFLKQGSENRIRRLEHRDALPLLLSQTIHRFHNPAYLNLLINHLDKLIQEIPIYELVNRPEPEAAQLSYKTMGQGAREAGL